MVSWVSTLQTRVLGNIRINREETMDRATTDGDGHHGVVHLTGSNLTIETLVQVGLGKDGRFPRVVLTDDACAKILRVRGKLQRKIDDGESMYGIDTGCGSRKDQLIPLDDLLAYQDFYARAHACGLGAPLPDHAVRGMILARLNSFARGHSGVTLELCQKLLELLNNNWLPVIPEAGSVGASGDLIPLAHLGAVLVGVPEARVRVEGKIITVQQLRDEYGYEPYSLKPKEAMGLTNGATMILSRACFAYTTALRYLNTANLAAALCLEAIRGERRAFDRRIHEARQNKGAQHVAATILRYLEGSQRTTRAAQAVPVCEPGDPERAYFTKERIQDRYSVRAVPQAHGTVQQTLWDLQDALTHELNASTDNPLMFEEGEDGNLVVLSGANFHGDPLSVPLEAVKIALAKLARISNDRLYGLLNKHHSYGLPADLTGSNRFGMTGLMISQYGAASDAAACAAMCFPATVMSIPTSDGQEDYVSMASISVWQLELLLPRLSFALTREIHGNCQAISLAQEKLGELGQLGTYTGQAYRAVREHCPPIAEDRFFFPELELINSMVQEGAFDYSNT